MQDPNLLKDQILKSILNSTTLEELEEIRINSLGKKGVISLLMKDLGKLDLDSRKEKGKLLNLVQKEINGEIQKRRKKLESKNLEIKLLNEKLDISLPSRPENEGRVHPLTKTINEVILSLIHI